VNSEGNFGGRLSEIVRMHDISRDFKVSRVYAAPTDPRYTWSVI